MKIIPSLICCLLVSSIAMAAEAESCNPTPKLATMNYPGVMAIPTTNDLLRPTGKPLSAEGQRMVLMGRVLDKNCTPIANATVEIWQVDPFGKWILATPGDIATPNPTFAGAGRTYTGDDGSFSFITAFPASTKKRAVDAKGKPYTIIYAPNVNIRVDANGLPAFSSQLYFAGDERNAADPVLKKLSIEGRARVMLTMQPMSDNPADGNYGAIDIVLPGETPYKGY